MIHIIFVVIIVSCIRRTVKQIIRYYQYHYYWVTARQPEAVCRFGVTGRPQGTVSPPHHPARVVGALDIPEPVSIPVPSQDVEVAVECYSPSPGGRQDAGAEVEVSLHDRLTGQAAEPYDYQSLGRSRPRPGVQKATAGS